MHEFENIWEHLWEPFSQDITHSYAFPKQFLFKLFDCFSSRRQKLVPVSLAAGRLKVAMFSISVESLGTCNGTLVTGVCCLAVFEDVRIWSSTPGPVLRRPRRTSTCGAQLSRSREAGNTSALLRRTMSVSSHFTIIRSISSDNGLMGKHSSCWWCCYWG